ncbi:ATP-binding cassette, subfamily B/ATP-binding cassette, subfamily B, multidrug efflux pump [Nitrosomonas cryotolerans]|uniref:ATP-binding cassette, subfamily B, multidrug efflux pump n=1 Tax=Nitrosomonas cryotolerans ATCC 49181 TaxID=1131553 RepID=A0A1N6JHK4_9PROT|nr:ABC transporter ATP-binding protein [Nitrosomonas cryotolerans]SFQ15760.1 ATP-binding cassette, subfamily B/ATP-binding cassette, subfamily B, multidrug efflux pump [Nitrosomonas cryotolerans]SIO43661.1 ATP-binding cassette, subfamily B, multidrug efflux pump [Nitrosomonas cryotolerans ATCC 49181]
MFSFFERLTNPFPPEHPTEPPKGLYLFCRHYTRGIEPYLLLMAILTTGLAISEALLYGILGQMVDWLATKDSQNFLQDEWQTLLAMSLFILIFIPILVLMHALVTHQTLMGNFPMMVRWLSHRYLLNQSYAFFQHDFSGRIATKVLQTALAVRETVMKLLDVILFVTVYLATTLVLVANADLRLCLPLLAWLVAYLIILFHFIPQLKHISTLQADARSLMTGRIVDSYTNIITLKLFSQNQRESAYAQAGMQEFMATVHPQMRLVTWLKICVWTINMLLIFITGTLGIYLWINDAMGPGAIAIVLSLAIRLTGMSHWVMWEVSNLFENIGTVQDGINTLSNPQSITDTPNAHDLQIKRGAIHFNHVGFSYALEADKPDQPKNIQIFDDLNLQIGAGEKIGIVGRSGAGKSTFVSLLLRFYDVQQGSISIDGQDIRQVSQDSLRANIAMVAQDISLLHRSVRDNILFGKPDATEAQMIQAAQQAQAHEFIQALTDSKGRKGYDAHVGERGITLSGGQRQRIAIARVLLKNAPILVLDEATSALDSEVEISIQQSLYQLMEGKTVIAIAHRLSTIAAMDRLVVFDKGRIVEQGSHAKLIANNQLYAQLWNHQSGGFLGFLEDK